MMHACKAEQLAEPVGINKAIYTASMKCNKTVVLWIQNFHLACNATKLTNNKAVYAACTAIKHKINTRSYHHNKEKLSIL